ncbi:Uncharacterised protein [Clostridium putrefaciens]|uniref:Uncharacterized protein n=1 Tax=Clostridium putrefaciens TaxID=99675 RepID=A0A381JCD9_9CLOT|nr:hypothetical protein [Clostridium putrefaciens]SUY48067.1 Uncharacterised protein [Clostridium putrefaciens]
MSSYALQLPNNYVEIEREEMEYVDGGAGFLYDVAVSTLGSICAAGAIAAGIKIYPYMVTAAIAAYSWVGSAVTAAATIIVANPVASAAILAGCAGVVTGYIIGHYS